MVKVSTSFRRCILPFFVPVPTTEPGDGGLDEVESDDDDNDEGEGREVWLRCRSLSHRRSWYAVTMPVPPTTMTISRGTESTGTVYASGASLM